MQRVLKVCESGVCSAKPDLIKATVRLLGVRDTYGKAARDFKESFDFLIEKAKEEFSFKTADFYINTNYVDERGDGNIWKKKFAGYMFSHTLCCEFAFDTAKLGRFVNILSDCKCVESFGFDYALSDMKAARDSACAQAVKNAKEKAHVLAAAAQVKLGEIVSVEFGSSERYGASPRMYKMNDRAAVVSASLDIAPSNLNVSESVEIVWELN